MKKNKNLLTKHRLIQKRTSYVAELAVLLLPRRHKVSKSSLIARDNVASVTTQTANIPWPLNIEISDTEKNINKMEEKVITIRSR